MTEQNQEQVVVIGAGHGGGLLVAFLRQYGYKGAITLIGDEPILPYQRPPLSKAWLKGEVKQENLFLRPANFYTEQNVATRLNTRVEKVDAAARQITLSNGEQLAYNHLVMTMGAHARPLPVPGAQLDNVLSLRTMADAERIRGALGPGKKLVIIGGGYIGLECAATARGLGAEVVLLERAPRLLERVASAEVSSFLHQFHAKRGVDIEVNAAVTAIEGQQAAEFVVLADGRKLPCDLVLVGVGAIPTDALAREAGLNCDNGIVVDADCRTSDSNIFAIGDIANRPHPLYGNRMIRLESVPSAMEQAKRVATVLTGREPAAAEVPWFWSDQYELKLQMAGMAFDVDETVVRGNPEEAKFAVFHLSKGHVVTVECINAPPEFFAGKKLISSGKPVDSKRLADLAVSLNELA